MLRMIKKLALATLAVFFIAIVLAISSLYYIVPFDDLSRLKAGQRPGLMTQSAREGDEFSYQWAEIISNENGWTFLDEISPYLVFAVIATEDWSFYQHQGVDFNQLKEAISDLYRGERIRGASTLTQQVVKNLFLDHSFTLTRKVKEMIIALFLERYLSKDQILEIYLNIAHWGRDRGVEGEKNNFYGILASSQYYFEKEPHQLNAKEAAFLAALLPSPVRYSQSFYREELSSFLQQRIEYILHALRVKGVIDREMYQQMKKKRLSFEKTSASILTDVLERRFMDVWGRTIFPEFLVDEFYY